MNEEKKVYQSKTIIGALVAIAVPVANMFGYKIDPTLSLDILNTLTVTGDLIESLIATGGALLAIYGRITATKAIS